jgi:hypothetical protein
VQHTQGHGAGSWQGRAGAATHVAFSLLDRRY